jgi:hypothetical protein
MLDDTNKTLFINERTIKELNVKIIEFKSKVKEGEIIIKELKNKNICESYISEIDLLESKVQDLGIENQTLKSTSLLRHDTRLDLPKLYVGQKTHDKMSLGFKKFSSFLTFNDTRSPKEKGEQPQKFGSKNDNMKNTEHNRKNIIMYININIQIKEMGKIEYHHKINLFANKNLF